MKVHLSRQDIHKVWDIAPQWVSHLDQIQNGGVYFTMTPQWMGLSADLYGIRGELFHTQVETPEHSLQHFLVELFEEEGQWRLTPALAPYPITPLWRFPVSNRWVPTLLRQLWDFTVDYIGHSQGEIFLPVYDEYLVLDHMDNHTVGEVHVLSNLEAYASIDQLAYQIRNHHLRKKLLKISRLRDVEIEVMVSPTAVVETLDLFLDPLDLMAVDRAFLTLVYPLLAQQGWLRIYLLRMEGWLVAAASVVYFSRRATVHLYWEKPYEFRIPFLWALSWHILEDAFQNHIMEMYNFPLELGGHRPVRSLRIRF